jgi:hypothetical protein
LRNDDKREVGERRWSETVLRRHGKGDETIAKKIQKASGMRGEKKRLTIGRSGQARNVHPAGGSVRMKNRMNGEKGKNNHMSNDSHAGRVG